MIKLSELQVKEVIIIDDGSRLGHISDLEIDTHSGRITAIIIPLKEKSGGFFGKPGELVIQWNQIVRIGSDVILVNGIKRPALYSESLSNDNNL
ncbi:YlmC/YmxH family sporulation protein [Virgibacillus indicus]|uniref:YlmC/YmxH family sporulation protein n=1 Tax=Virgibacillus indicus TaxID=2024554 RepID=A0A265NEC3_9BACI|nr:YlmC/YmxH family sporulation protein [Virgibacillus indicus]OZU90400.1 YlmC/YmxH family sporulation protein [Virgibacillus indicus]